jgi:PAS domain S-box-containing protein
MSINSVDWDAEAAQWQSFLTNLSDRLRSETNPETLLREANRALGEELGALRVGYGEIDVTGEYLTLKADWSDGVGSNAGTFPLDSFGPRIVAENRAGRTFIIGDLAADDRIAPEHKAAFAHWGVGALVAVPLIKVGRFTAILSVQSAHPRIWSALELRTIEEVAQRTWEALERARAEAALRATQDRQAFLLALGDRLRRHTDAAAVLKDSVDMLGRHLATDRVGYAETDMAADSLSVDVDWTNGRLESIVGSYSLTSFGRHNVAALARGETVRIDDSVTSPLLDDDSRPAFAAMGIRSAVTVPLVRQERLVALLSVHHAAPREWTDAELQLVEEVAERTWAILERARAEEALRKSEERLRIAIEGAELGTWDYDLLTMEGWWSPRTCAIYGVPYVDVIPPDLRFGLVHPDDVERYLHEVDEAVYAGRPFSIEYRIVRPDGQVRWVVLRGTVTSDAAGVPARATGIALDVTERREVEERLRESQALLAAFMENAPIGMYLKDTDGRYVLVNPEMAKVLGVSVDEALGRTAREVLGDEEAERIAAEEKRAFAEGTAQVRDQFFPERSDHSSAQLIRFPVSLGGRPPRIGGFAIDTTERFRAEAELARSREALHQSEKLTALGSLLAGVAHELNNPLAVVVAHAMMLEEEAEGTSHADDARKIRRAAERCAKIVSTFLAMARQKAPERSAVDVNVVARAALDLAGYGLRTAGVEVTTDFAADLPRLMADEDQLHQVLANLVVNAQQALLETTGPRRLTLRTRKGMQDTVEVEIADTGPGIPLDVQRRIFEPFYTTKPQGAGTGLGLSFSMGVAQAHGGRLELAESLPSGTTFRLTLPAHEPEASQGGAAGAVAAPAPLASAAALVVDDEPDLTDALAIMLRREGYDVTTASSGREAQALLTAREFDLILSDLRMPDIDGPALYGWLQRERPRLADRVGFITGDTLGAEAVRFLTRAGRPFVEKPFTQVSVQRLLAELVAEGRR